MNEYSSSDLKFFVGAGMCIGLFVGVVLMLSFVVIPLESELNDHDPCDDYGDILAECFMPGGAFAPPPCDHTPAFPMDR